MATSDAPSWTQFLRDELDRTKDDLREERQTGCKLREQLSQERQKVARLEEKVGRLKQEPIRENPAREEEIDVKLRQRDLEHEIKRLKERKSLGETLLALLDGPAGEKLADSLAPLTGALATAWKAQQNQAHRPKALGAPTPQGSGQGPSLKQRLAGQLLQLAAEGAGADQVDEQITRLTAAGASLSPGDWAQVLTSSLQAAQQQGIPAKNVVPMARAAAGRFGLEETLREMAADEVVGMLMSYAGQAPDQQPPLRDYLTAIVDQLKEDPHG